MGRTEFIQSIIDRIEAKSYLEIGTQYGYNFDKIKCQKKVGVDPKEYDREYLKMTSNEFFNQNKDTFDVIFIDGLHHSDQVIEDVENALMCLNDKGVIVCHDCNPRSKEEQEIPERHLKSWTGDVWRAFLYFRRFRELTTICFDIDTGMGFIQKRPVIDTLDLSYEDIQLMTYEDFNNNRERLLNLKDEDYFKIILSRLELI
jgi:predicted O-methyltransferase YrrM